MNRSLILILMISATSGIQAQTLKDALFSGKLKSDTGTVLRKGEDLTGKIDSTRKKPEPEKVKTVETKPAVTGVFNSQTGNVDSTSSDLKSASKDNNTTWNNFVNSVVDVLKTEVLNSKKIKKGDYSVTVDYAIDLTGQVTITNIFVIPESKFLEEQVKERLTIDTPVLNPVLGSNGTPRKTNKRVGFKLTKS